MGFDGQCESMYVLVKFTSAWGTIAEILGLRHALVAANSWKNDADHEIMVQSAYLSWIVSCTQRKALASSLRSALDNVEKIAQTYHEVAMLRNAGDVERILQCIASIEEHAIIPLFHRSLETDNDQNENLTFAKNNVAAFRHGYSDHAALSSTTATESAVVPLAAFFIAVADHPANVADDTGYLTVKTYSQNANGEFNELLAASAPIHIGSAYMFAMVHGNHLQHSTQDVRCHLMIYPKAVLHATAAM